MSFTTERNRECVFLRLIVGMLHKSSNVNELIFRRKRGVLSVTKMKESRGHAVTAKRYYD